MKFRQYFISWLSITTIWLVILNVLSGVVVLNIRAFMKITRIEFSPEQHDLAHYLLSDSQFLEATLFGILFGTSFFLIHQFTERTRFHRLSYLKLILLKSLLYVVSVFVAMLLMVILFLYLEMIPMQVIHNSIWSEYSWNYYLFFLMVFGLIIMMVNFLLVIYQKFGPGQFFPILFGKYHQPMVESRIFMFLDLKSSTTYAEQLGHLAYSRLIQDCFFELNQLVPRFKAEIYQYVGDEVVLSWKYRDGLEDLNCIKLFFVYQNILQSKSSYFEKKYRTVPVFKAGLNGGEITVAEVGHIKKEIAYHGDVLNTAARLRDLCTVNNQPLLCSSDLARFLAHHPFYTVKVLGNFQLKGKRKAIEVFAVVPNHFKEVLV
jgi:adenylate cyclase